MTKNVDVLIRAHGDSRYLENAIESVQTQMFAGELRIHVTMFELRPELLSRLAAMSIRKEVCLHPCDKAGYAYPLNLMIQCAEGRYVAILDHDDLMHKSRIQRQFDFLELHPDVSAVGSSVRLIDSLGNEIGSHHYESRPEKIRNSISRKSPLAHPAAMISREALTHIGGYRDFYDTAEDYDLWLRLSEFSNLSNLGETLTDYRLHESQVTHTSRFRNLTASIAAVESAKRRRSRVPEIHELFDTPHEYGERLSVKTRVNYQIFCENLLRNFRRFSLDYSVLRAGFYLALLILVNPKKAIWAIRLAFRKLNN